MNGYSTVSVRENGQLVSTSLTPGIAPPASWVKSQEDLGRTVELIRDGGRLHRAHLRKLAKTS